MISALKKGPVGVELSNGVHSFLSDVGVDSLGEDKGLNPHEILEASLAACTSMTLTLYAKRKNWDVKDLKVEVKILKEGDVTAIQRTIFFGEMPQENKVKLLQIADKCPVHKILVGNVTIETGEK